MNSHVELCEETRPLATYLWIGAPLIYLPASKDNISIISYYVRVKNETNTVITFHAITYVDWNTYSSHNRNNNIYIGWIGVEFNVGKLMFNIADGT